MLGTGWMMQFLFFLSPFLFFFYFLFFFGGGVNGIEFCWLNMGMIECYCKHTVGTVSHPITVHIWNLSVYTNPHTFLPTYTQLHMKISRHGQKEIEQYSWKRDQCVQNLMVGGNVANTKKFWEKQPENGEHKGPQTRASSSEQEDLDLTCTWTQTPASLFRPHGACKQNLLGQQWT